MLKIYPIGVICPCSRMYKIMKEIYIKSEFKAVFVKPAANEQSSKTSFVAWNWHHRIIPPAQESI